MSRDHRKLRAFELADGLVLAVYSTTRGFPRDELFGLTAQMRRAAVSVAANIVEGSARPGARDYSHFLAMAHASLRDVGYLISLAARLKFLSPDAAAELEERYNETARVLSGLISSMKVRTG